MCKATEIAVRIMGSVMLKNEAAEKTVRREDKDNYVLGQALQLTLEITDAEVATELLKCNEGPERNFYALSALRLGVLALQRARGELDSQTIRQAGERIVLEIKTVLTEHATGVTKGLATLLTQYLDPAAGVLPQRLERLLKKDGELDMLLTGHVGGDSSQLAQTLSKHLGENSAVFRLLSPNQSDGFLNALTGTIGDILAQQREVVLKEFSLDSNDSALSRLVHKVTDSNGRLRDEFRKDLDSVTKEFSLDVPDSALSRLVGQVDKAQRGIAEQFSLDLENSSLSRLKGELTMMLERMDGNQKQFQIEVMATLTAFQTRRLEASRSTRHGPEFQAAGGEVLGLEVSRLGDLFTTVGQTTGVIRNCKIGDYLAQLGPESAAPEERIVIEAKAAGGYDVGAALEELKTARVNRGAQIGIFIFSKKCAPDGLHPLSRFGQDIIVVWDQDDVATDIYLRAAYSLARHMAVRQTIESTEMTADFKVIDSAMAEIVCKVNSLDEITTWTQTISSNSSKILDRVRMTKETLERQIELLNDHLHALRRS
jgi:uncharacterized membrane protein YheB (UPF0754 family)